MATRRYNIPINQDIPTHYASDLNDQEFGFVAPHVAQKEGSGKKRTVDIREVLNAIFYRTRTGCQWRMLPSDFPVWNHVWYYYRKWRDDGTWEHINTLLRRDVRTKAGCDPEPSVGIIDSQSVEATEMGGEKGFDPAKQVKGRKRHLMSDTLGLILMTLWIKNWRRRLLFDLQANTVTVLTYEFGYLSRERTHRLHLPLRATAYYSPGRGRSTYETRWYMSRRRWFAVPHANGQEALDFRL